MHFLKLENKVFPYLECSNQGYLLIFVETLRLNGGLNHITLIFHFSCYLLVWTYYAVSEMLSCLNQLLTNELLHKSSDFLNVVSSADRVLTLLDILPGRFLIIFGGWLNV